MEDAVFNLDYNCTRGTVVYYKIFKVKWTSEEKDLEKTRRSMI
jgi:hypothetical protein